MALALIVMEFKIMTERIIIIKMSIIIAVMRKMMMMMMIIIIVIIILIIILAITITMIECSELLRKVICDSR